MISTPQRITNRVSNVNTTRVGLVSQSVKNEAMSFANNLRRLRKARGITQEQLALAAGFPTQSRISNYESHGSSRREPSEADARAIAIALGVTIGELYEFTYARSGEGSREPASCDIRDGEPAPFLRPILAWNNPDDLPPDATVFLNKLDFYLSAGHGGPDPNAVEQTDKVTPFRADFCAAEGWTPKTHFTMRCIGESMEPTIQHGAPVVIATNELNIRSGRVYAVLIDGEPLLKRLDKLPGGRIRVRSDNSSPAYCAFEVDENELQVIGRAVWTPVKL